MSRLRGYLHDLRTLPGDARLAYGHEGLEGAWKALASRLVHRVVRGGRLIVYAHSVDLLVDSAPPAGVHIALARHEDLAALASLVGQRELHRFRRLLSAGRQCLVAWRGEAAVGYAWIALRIGPDVAPWPLPFAFPSIAAYHWNLYVLPSERSSGIGSALAAARLRVTRDAGFREGWRMVAPSNAPSLRTVQKTAMGTRVVGEITFVQLLGRSYSRFTPRHR